MWIKADSGNWFDASKIVGVAVVEGWGNEKLFDVEAELSGGRCTLALATNFKTEADAQVYADEFVAKNLAKEN